MDSVIRLHNFCRDRKIEVPEGGVSVTLPTEITFDEEGDLTCDFYEPEPIRNGRPSKDQVVLSETREAIRARLEVQSIVRPEENKDRNASRTR